MTAFSRLTTTMTAALACAASIASAAPASFDFHDRGPYLAGVPRPVEVLGYEPGTFHTNYGNMERYVEALVRGAPDRVRREAFGRTVEFRERALLVIASPENLARLDAIREASRRIADPRLASPAEAERLIRETPASSRGGSGAGPTTPVRHEPRRPGDEPDRVAPARRGVPALAAAGVRGPPRADRLLLLPAHRGPHQSGAAGESDAALERDLRPRQRRAFDR